MARRRLLPAESRVLRRYLAKSAGRIADHWITASRETLGSIDLKLLTNAIAQQETLPRIGSVYTYARINTLIGAFEVNLEPLLRRMVAKGGELAAPVMAEALGIPPIDLGAFRAEAARIADEILAQAVKRISDEARKLIRSFVREGYDAGLSPGRIATKIKRVIGLDERRARALEKFIAGLDPKSFETRKEMLAAIRAERHRLLRSRAATIGRTETSIAAAETQNLLWRRAVAEGTLSATRYVKVWMRVAGARQCPICSPLAGQRARIGGSYVVAGKTYRMPPGHPNCICGEYLDDWQANDELLPEAAPLAA